MDKNKTVEVLDFTNCQIRLKNNELSKIRNKFDTTPMAMKNGEELLSKLRCSVINLMLFYKCKIKVNEVKRIFNSYFKQIAHHE